MSMTDVEVQAYQFGSWNRKPPATNRSSRAGFDAVTVTVRLVDAGSVAAAGPATVATSPSARTAATSALAGLEALIPHVGVDGIDRSLVDSASVDGLEPNVDVPTIDPGRRRVIGRER
jgi:hypothetical protein